MYILLEVLQGISAHSKVAWESGKPGNPHVLSVLLD